MSREPDAGLDPRTLGSRPEPNRLSHPGAPEVRFYWCVCAGLSEEGLVEEPSEWGEGAGHVCLAAA